MVHYFNFNKKLVQISQVEWRFICDGIKLFVSTSSFSLIHHFFLGFCPNDFWLKLSNLVKVEVHIVQAPIWSDAEVRVVKFDPLLSSMSSIVIFCVLTLVILVLAEILMV